MHTYHAFYRGHTLELTADTSINARDKAVEQFRKNLKLRVIKSYDVTVILVSNGEVSPSILGA